MNPASTRAFCCKASGLAELTGAGIRPSKPGFRARIL
jgi:hypothetical protein